jgi:hypothetical protein
MITKLPTAPRLYPDTVTMKRIDLANEKSTTDNYWTKSTQQALTKALQPVELSEATDILCLGHNGWAPDYLDIVHEKAPNAHITVLDTQANQIKTMEGYFEEHTPRTPADNYTLLATADFTKPPETLYDLVLLYHLTNHIPTTADFLYQQSLKNYLKPDGTVVMLTAHNTDIESICKPDPYYSEPDPNFVTRSINEETNIVETTWIQQDLYNGKLKEFRIKEKELPTRRMNSDSINRFFNALNVKLTGLVPFHFDRCDLNEEAQTQRKYAKESTPVGQDIIAVGTKINVDA